jgi:hypothetical protein
MKTRNANLIWNNRFAVSLTAGFTIFLFIDVIYNNGFAEFLASVLFGMILIVLILRVVGEKNEQ